MKNKLLTLITSALISTTIFSQTFVNRTLQSDFGQPVFNPVLNPLGIQWSQTIRGISGNMLTVAHTWINGQGENILLSKRDSKGNLIFQTTYNSGGAMNDYGIAVAESSNGEIFVCGTTDNGGSTNYDAIILKYNANGNLLASSIYPGNSGMNDIGTALQLHPLTGHLIVTLTSQNTATGYDYVVLELDPVGLSTLNSSSYDGANLTDIALGLEVDAANGNIIVVGYSQSSIMVSGYATAVFNQSLNFVSATRTDLTGSPTDQPIAFKKYGSNIYITGKTFTGNGYDVKTVKINSNYTIAWTITKDFNGLDDIGNTIDVDPTTGDVIIGGLCTKANNSTDMFSIRYNGTTGATIGSPFVQPAESQTGSSVMKKLCTSSTGDVYFVAGENGVSGNKQVIVGKLLAGGLGGWQKKVINPTQDILPSDIQITPDGIFAISVKDSIAKKFTITGYNELILDTTKKYIGGKACWKSGELLVAFNPAAMNRTTVDSDIQFGDLSAFLTSSANTAINNNLQKYCRDCKIQAVKVYSMKTTDSVAVTRQGNTVSMPSFWSTLLLKLPSSLNETQAQSIFNSVSSVVAATQLNNFIEVQSVPNDSLYSAASNLHPTISQPNANINVEQAWNIASDCGVNSVKGGLFDTGVMWRHKDFGYNGSPTSGANKMRGWYFAPGFGPSSTAYGGVDMRTQSYIMSDFMLDNFNTTGHGTEVAGIIGALRNNTSGIAGIAGGDGTNNNPGVKLFSLNVAAYTMYWYLQAMHEGHRDSTSAQSMPYAYGVHFSNHSYKLVPGWWPADSFPIVNREVHWINRLGCTMVCSRGNDSTNNYVLPAGFDPNWAISVGASDATGGKWSGSSYGSDMDVIAPGVPQTVVSTSNDRSYQSFSGTSSAAPHASGVVGLLMSYMNDPNNHYMNLAPEDCDFIIQRSATDLGPTGYDSINGFGRLNAGQALRMVYKNDRIFYHYGTNSLFPHAVTKGLYANWDTIKLTEVYENYASPRVTYNPGKYIVKTFQVNATVSHAGMSPIDSIMYYWPRHSASYVYSLPTSQKQLNMHERVIINSLSTGGAVLTGYVYQVKDSTGTNVGWWPCDTSFTSPNLGSLFEYSIISKNKTNPVGIEENVKDGIGVTLHPNPASSMQSLIINVDAESSCNVDLYDMMGRYIRNVYLGKVEPGSNTIQHNIGDLPNSLYLYFIRTNGKTISKKFIKE